MRASAKEEFVGARSAPRHEGCEGEVNERHDARVILFIERIIIKRIISNNPTDPAPQHIREQYEARNAVDGDDEEDDAPTTAPRSNGEVACEIRRVGDKKWRRFASRVDADGVFPGLSWRNISKLISNAPGSLAPPHIRKLYEARDAIGGDGELAVAARGPADSDDDEEDDAPTTAPRSNGELACEIRRVGDKKWRRFASRSDAARAFPGLEKSYICRLITNPTKSPCRSTPSLSSNRLFIGCDDARPRSSFQRQK